MRLSSDGTIVAIGADYNVGNGDRSGHVRITLMAKQHTIIVDGQ